MNKYHKPEKWANIQEESGSSDEPVFSCMLVHFTSRFMVLTHCGREDLWKWAIFTTILTSPKSWLSQEDLEAGYEYSLVPMDS